MQKLIKLTLVCCLSTSLQAYNTVAANEATANTNSTLPLQNKIVDKTLPTQGQVPGFGAPIQDIPTKGKVLEGEQMRFLNTVFKGAPIGLVHFRMAANAARSILAVLPKSPDDPQTMAIFVKKLVKPLEPFLDRIKGFADTLLPLIRMSLNAQPPAHLTGFVGQEKTSAAYFETALNNKSQVERACKEFMQFYLDIYASIDPDTRQGFDDLWHQIVVEQKKAAQARA
jgi:hypothetical protein